MNKKEVSEIKKNFKEDSRFFTLNKILLTMVNMDGEEIFTKNQNIFTISDREQEMYYTILRNVLNTSVGKKLIQYDFDYSRGGEEAQHTLYNVVASKAQDAVSVETYVERILGTTVYPGPYALVTAHCTYTVRRKNKKDDIDEDNTEEYNFIVGAFCPAHTVDSGFSYNNQTGDFSTESDSRLYISPKPTDGFIYPTFDNRSPNANSVMYYCKTPKNINTSIIEDALGCSFDMSPVLETQNFNYLIAQTFGESTNYGLIYELNDALINYYDDFRNETEPIKVGADDIADIMRDLGVSDDELDKFKALYKGICGDCKLNIVNIINSKIKLQTSEYTISFKSWDGNRVAATVVDGSRAIKLPTDDTMMVVNDIPTQIK